MGYCPVTVITYGRVSLERNYLKAGKKLQGFSGLDQFELSVFITEPKVRLGGGCKSRYAHICE
jgi:hypothetical protein